MLKDIIDKLMAFFMTKHTIFGDIYLLNWYLLAAIAALLVMLIIVIIVAVADNKKAKAAQNDEEEAVADEASEDDIIPESVFDELAGEEDDSVAKDVEPASTPEDLKEEVIAAEPMEETAAEEVIEEVKEETAQEELKEEVVDQEPPKESPAEAVIEEAKKEPLAAAETKEEPVAKTKPKEKPATSAKPKKKPVEAPAPKEEPKEVKAPEEVLPAERRKTRYAGKGVDSVFGIGYVEEKYTYNKPVAKKKEEEPMLKKTVQTKSSAATKPAAKTTKPAAKAPASKPVAKAPAKQTAKAPAKEEKKTAVFGKFEICNAIGGFRYLLSANNGQLLYESKDYKTFASCSDAINKFIASVKAGDFRVRGDKFGNYKFNLKSNTSNNIVYVGESYSTKKACENAVDSVKRFAPAAKIIDITEADYVAPASAFNIPAATKKEVAAGKGAAGKWEIALAEPNNAASPYVFLLYANNGQLLYESRDYKSYEGCKSGIDTFIKTLKDGQFIIDSDKFGRYKFILRKAGNQVEYFGQNYSDKAACTRSAISVYKFGLLTPVE